MLPKEIKLKRKKNPSKSPVEGKEEVVLTILETKCSYRYIAHVGQL